RVHHVARWHCRRVAACSASAAVSESRSDWASRFAESGSKRIRRESGLDAGPVWAVGCGANVRRGGGGGSLGKMKNGRAPLGGGASGLGFNFWGHNEKGCSVWGRGGGGDRCGWRFVCTANLPQFREPWVCPASSGLLRLRSWLWSTARSLLSRLQR